MLKGDLRAQEWTHHGRYHVGSLSYVVSEWLVLPTVALRDNNTKHSGVECVFCVDVTSYKQRDLLLAVLEKKSNARMLSLMVPDFKICISHWFKTL